VLNETFSLFQLPFTQAQFLDVFRQYHAGIGIGQALILGVGVTGLSFAFWENRVASRVVSGVLSVLWLWMAIVYHGIYFSRISAIAPVLAAIFAVQSVLFAIAAYRETIGFRFSPTWRGWLGSLVIIYSMAVYPAMGFVYGHYYPSAPSFGTPCPTVIFTLGLLLWSNASWRILAIPLLWAAIGTSAAVLLKMPQDYGLAVAALLVVLLPKTAHGHPGKGIMAGRA
jgi:Family of unknown function (DUF6064)